MTRRDLSKCNKCGEPLRAGICSDAVNCLLDRVASAHVAVSVGRTHIGRMARPSLPLHGLRDTDPIDLVEFAHGDVKG